MSEFYSYKINGFKTFCQEEEDKKYHIIVSKNDKEAVVAIADDVYDAYEKYEEVRNNDGLSVSVIRLFGRNRRTDHKRWCSAWLQWEGSVRSQNTRGGRINR